MESLLSGMTAHLEYERTAATVTMWPISSLYYQLTLAVVFRLEFTENNNRILYNWPG